MRPTYFHNKSVLKIKIVYINTSYENIFKLFCNDTYIKIVNNLVR